MANGYCPAMLRQIADIAEGNASARKMSVTGFTAMLFCCQNSSVSPVNDGNQANGHRTSLTVSYRRRPLESDTDTTDNCDISRIPAKLEWTIPNLGFRKISWYLADDTVAQYCAEASIQRPFGAGLPSIMQEHYDLFLEHANTLMSAINTDLVTSAATQFGNNVTTGSSAGKVINISRDGNAFILDNGIIDMQRDFQENEFCGTPCVVGGGYFAAYDIARAAACCSSAGIDNSKIGLPDFFYDKKTQSIWGPNTVGVFTPGSVKFLGWNAYVGAFAGQRGMSYFGTIAFPVDAFRCNAEDCMRDLVFDVQMRYIDCPTTVNVAGTPTSVNRGWEVTLSKRFALWVQPKTAYSTGDPLENTNGTLKYFISNNTPTTKSYAYTG